MNQSYLKFIVGLVTCLSLGGAIISCAGSNSLSSTGLSLTATPTPTPGNGTTGTPVGATPPPASSTYPFTVKATMPVAVYNVMHLDSDWTKSCSIDVNQSAVTAKDIICNLEVEEGDLYFHPWTMDWTVPVGACPFVAVEPYWFMQWSAGVGSSSFSYTILSNGSIANLSDSSNTVIANGNEVSCKYDHTKEYPEGPNACQGAYTANITTITTSGTTSSVTNGKWSGAIGNAVSGPGGDLPRTSFTKLPLTMYYDSYAGRSESVKIKAPINHNDRVDKTNLYVENYMLNPAALPGALTPYGNNYYTFYCLDGGHEVLGRIRVAVRGWNLASELAKGAAGDPTSTGGESSGVGDKNDRHNWDDVKADTTTYPGGYPASNL